MNNIFGEEMMLIDISLEDLIKTVAEKALVLTSENKIHWKKIDNIKYKANLTDNLTLTVEYSNYDYYHVAITYDNGEEQIIKSAGTRATDSAHYKLFKVAEMFCDDFTHVVMDWVNKNNS